MRIAAASRPACAKGMLMPSNLAAWDEQAYFVSDRKSSSVVGLKLKSSTLLTYAVVVSTRT